MRLGDGHRPRGGRNTASSGSLRIVGFIGQERRENITTHGRRTDRRKGLTPSASSEYHVRLALRRNKLRLLFELCRTSRATIRTPPKLLARPCPRVCLSADKRARGPQAKRSQRSWEHVSATRSTSGRAARRSTFSMSPPRAGRCVLRSTQQGAAVCMRFLVCGTQGGVCDRNGK